MAIIQRGECLKEEKLKEQNEEVEKNVVRKILQAFDEPVVREQFKDLIVYYKKRLYSDGRLFCPDIFLWKEDLGIVLVEVKAWDKNFILKEVGKI
jgi:predicted nuclease of restriction endonuclease-like RecB superfamily